MNVNKYLKDLVEKCGTYSVTEGDNKIIEKKGIQEFILGKLRSKKFRKWKLPPKALEIINVEVSSAIAENRPIRIFFAQGSYKLWKVRFAPKANWAEFFNLHYLLTYISPIAAVYKPGIELTYHFLTILPQKHNNLSEREVLQYFESFKSLIDKVGVFLPDNLQVFLEKEVDCHSSAEYISMLSRGLKIASKEFYEWPSEKRDDYLRRAQLNIKWRGVEDWTTLNEDEKKHKIENAVLYEYAATQIILEKDKINRGIILSTLNRYDSIGVGSTSTSIVKHWVGVGVLEEIDGEFYPRILSPTQYEYAKTLKYETFEVRVIPEPSFLTIDVYQNHFDFSE